ncbi:MAG TPA: fumarate hydratase [Methanosarcinales archaeon]|nr:fumarate hydratase [Methanosarcinales archaeon]
MTLHHLQTPLTLPDILGLRAGDLVYLDGTVFTARDRAHERILQRSKTPFDPAGAVIYHCGPVMKEVGRSWQAIAAGPTTSARMDSQTGELLKRFGVRAIIGKGGMSVTDAMLNRCVYLAAIGGCAVVAADRIVVRDVRWLDLGMAEAVWVLDVHDFGPLIVGIDAHGRNLFDEVKSRSEKRLSAMF